MKANLLPQVTPELKSVMIVTGTVWAGAVVMVGGKAARRAPKVLRVELYWAE